MKYFILTASILIQVCLGGLYAWSSFVPALQASYGFSTAQTQLVFGGLIATFTVAMVFAGRLLERRGPRLVAGIGALLFGAGYILASLSDGSFPMLFFAIGIVAGTATGFGYVCPLATCMKWFPHHKGLVTGVAVAGFGGGAVLLSGLAEVLFARGIDVPTLFRLIGLVYGITILAAALVLRFPLQLTVKRPRPSPQPGKLLRDPFFITMIIGIFCGTFAGLLVIGNLKPLALSTGASSAIAAVVVSVFAVGNALGRIVWGGLADRMGTRSIPLSLFFLAVPLGLLGLAAFSPVIMVVLSFLIGFGFGACFIVYAAQVASRYGQDRIGSLYPLVFLGYGAAGIAGPWLGGWLFDLTSSYTYAIGVSVAVVITGILICIRLLRIAKSSVYPATQLSRSP